MIAKTSASGTGSSRGTVASASKRTPVASARSLHVDSAMFTTSFALQ